MEQIGRTVSSLRFTGTQVNYYFVCHRKLWLFTHGVEMEHGHDLVLQGKLVGQTTYARKDHEVAIDNRIVLDFLQVDRDVSGRLVIHEIKKSRALEEAHIWQALYYLLYLKEKGVEAYAVLDYPMLRRRERVELTEERERALRRILVEIGRLVAEPKPPKGERTRVCRRCAYFDFCWT